MGWMGERWRDWGRRIGGWDPWGVGIGLIEVSLSPFDPTILKGGGITIFSLQFADYDCGWPDADH